VPIRELALEVLLEWNLLRIRIKLGEQRAEALGKEGVPAGKLQEQLGVLGRDDIVKPVGDVLGAGIEVGFREVLDPIVNVALTAASDSYRLFVTLGDAVENFVDIVEGNHDSGNLTVNTDTKLAEASQNMNIRCSRYTMLDAWLRGKFL
jgi:hypothetical protein